MVKVPAVTELRLFRFFVSLLISGSILVSCGLDEYPYLEPVEPGIPMVLNTTAYIRLPDSLPNYFRNFIIYYRIYISGQSETGTIIPDRMASLNPALATDYNNLLSSTTANTTNTPVPSSMDIFSNRKYYPLALESTAIESVLDDNIPNPVGGITITLDFATNSVHTKPSLILGPADLSSNNTSYPPRYPQYQLFRSDYNMRPYDANNRYFINSDEINNPDHIDTATSTNLDIQNNTNIGYTYVSMYIIAFGLDPNTFSNIYSTPTFIGVFMLPDPN
ncbi:hypothetical protein AGMMS49944_03370 [Spirochaetia bacterium]|nr:hypothetical protein AGMMS49944_03370 [Spirochaetia bacterium]